MRRVLGRPRGIAADLALLIGAVLLPFLLLNGFFSYRSIQDERATIEATALREAQATALRLDELVAETRSLLTVLARTPVLHDDDPLTTRAFLLDLEARFSSYDGFLAADAAGNVYVSTGGSGGASDALIDQAFFQAVIREDRLLVSDVLLSPGAGEARVVIAMPVLPLDGRGTPIGAVGAVLDLRRLQQWFDNRPYPAGTLVMFIDSQGRVVGHNLDAERWVGQPLSAMPHIRTVLAERAGIGQGVDIDGVVRLHGFTTTEETSWHILVGVPTTTVDATVRRQVRLLGLWLGLATLATLAIALIAGREIIRPLRILTADAYRIADGDLDHRTTLARPSAAGAAEVQRLGLALNGMADELVASIAGHRAAQERMELAVAQVGHAMTSTTEPAAALTPLVEAAVALAQADAGLLLGIDDAEPILASAGLPLPTALPPPITPAGSDDDCDGTVERAAAALGMRQRLAVPVRVRGETLGTLVVLRAGATRFAEGEARLLRIFADQAAAAVEQSRLRAAVAQTAALRELQRLQAEFLTTASHELRAPVTGIKGYAELLLREDLPLDPTTRRECLTGINRLADRLAAQVRAFFDAMRAGDRRLTVRREPVDLHGVAASALHSFANRSELHQFALLGPPDLPKALADPERIEDVLINLLDNAVKYSPEGGAIELTVAARHPEGTEEVANPGATAQILVTVRDRGIGIAPQEQERVFERFYRLDRLTTRRAGGMGLGLYLCRAYIEGMGGRIWVESRLGEGSIFRFTLPLAPAPQARPVITTEVATP
ncbi:MAG: hypothetical protein AVDCRST_MAG18-4648 [uncultured Thermomicrobiales bacterium]|uniref:histidine kinase n=1 Tax=uncultured Thermomicrobiales bacterium TaxID=1645740 RepID=A0A6J4VY46_9BACT|nr:MAG: hypothetical protein AVDCRST_MAG18-4648 [uncultured Thermomicrobiales bacterium]